jgi:transposase
MDLTNEQWTLIDSLLPADRVRADGRGRPWTDRREVFNGILWILRTGAPWKDLPERYGKYQTVHRRFQNWVRSGVLEQVLLALAKDLHDRGGLNLTECFVDGTFVPAKKGGDGWAKPSAARAPNSWPLQTAMVFLSPFGQKVLARLKTPS